jgi:Family of unknown function (DUF6279)
MRVPLPAAITTTSIAVMVHLLTDVRIIRQHRPGWRRWLVNCILALSLVGLGGCSLIETTYNQSPFLLQWWLDRQLDLDSQQKHHLKGDLRALLAWHRQIQLPQVVRSVQGLIEIAPADLTPTQTCAFQNEVWQSLPLLAQQAGAVLARTALSLRPEQITHLRKYFEEDNAKWREEWLEGHEDERLQRRLKRSLERVEDYYGQLDTTQKTLLRETLRRSPYQPTIAWQERQRRQRDMIETLERIRLGQPELKMAQAELGDLIVRMFNPPIEAHRVHVQANAHALCAATSRIHNAMRPEQRQRALNKLSQQQQALARLLPSS